MSADKRSVHTDALETLGKIIDHTAARDAIHLAVEPCIAGEDLGAASDIGLIRGEAFTTAEKKLGIVDPFLKEYVRKGERFWMVLYPRTITSLRHVWSHPDFDDRTREEQEIAKHWLENYAKEIDEKFEDLIEAAEDWIRNGEYYYGERDEDGMASKFEGTGLHSDFWENYQLYTGKKVDEDKQHSFFTCSC